MLLVDPAGRILLVRFGPTPGGRYFWITPGGGLEDGETHEQAAHRELAEELALTGVDLGPVRWAREFIFTAPGSRGRVLQRERWYVVRTAGHVVAPAHLDSLAGEGIVDVRWWSEEELRVTGDSVAPRGLADLVADVLAGRQPAGAYDARPEPEVGQTSSR